MVLHETLLQTPLVQKDCTSAGSTVIQVLCAKYCDNSTVVQVLCAKYCDTSTVAQVQ